jgi:hypothetical protein
LRVALNLNQRYYSSPDGARGIIGHSQDEKYPKRAIGICKANTIDYGAVERGSNLWLPLAAALSYKRSGLSALYFLLR